ncbi:MAG: EAL domain-containing protein [Bryobacteraceae bacterium]|jgi:diguanylate cyclase (GGDEF)-like protein/PAS domain S-box-containing protein
MNENNHLLLVDDEAMNRDMLSRRLEHHGFRVDVAADGPAALQFIDAHRPDLVLLDQMMPGMTGVEVLQALRATYPATQLPVIMVTALQDSDKVVEALNLGANDYISKPVDFPVAVARIRGQLARKAAESALRESEERYALAARGSNEGLWDWDLATGRVYYSARWKAILGYLDGEIGEDACEWLSRVHPGDLEKLREVLRTEQGGGDSEAFESEHRIRHRDGTYRWMRCRGAAVQDSAGRAVRMAGSMSDVTAGKVFDPLTGLANRVLFMERLEQEFTNYRAQAAAPFAVMFLDIDRFKLINDGLGHLAGDQLLVAMAERLVRGVRTSDSGTRPASRDLPARLGGDEFAVLLCDLADPAAALRVAQRILTELREPFGLGDRGIFCTVSIGIAPCGETYGAADEMVRDADTAMYTAKSKGRSRCEVFDETMRTRVVERLQLENDLRRAVENQELSVNYQPKVRLTDRRICGFEALARWHHPQRGWIPPCEFIPVAEETGLIHDLDMWILRQACRQMQRWHTAYPSDPPLAISVNLSPSQFAQPHLVEQIAEVLRETGIDPPSLRLEITESVLMDDHEVARDVLTRLKGLGIGLKIDDFGTGYSSLAYLAQLPFDTMKIDRSFTLQLEGGDCNSEIVKSILEMAHTLGMQVVAEGVEQNEQITRLISMGCEFGQGYFFSKPLCAQDAEGLMSAMMSPVPVFPLWQDGEVPRAVEIPSGT